MKKIILLLSFTMVSGFAIGQTAPIKKKNYVDEQRILNVEAATPRTGYISAPYRKADGNWYEKTDAGVEQLIIDTVAMLATKYDLQNVSVDTVLEIATKYENREMILREGVENIRSVIANIEAGESNGNILFIGDSNTTPVERFVRPLQEHFSSLGISVGAGWHDATPSVTPSTGFTTVGVGITSNSPDGQLGNGLGGGIIDHSATFDNIGSTLTLGLTGPINYDYEFGDIYFERGTGDFSYNINGGGAVTVENSTGTGIDTIQIYFGSVGQHTVVFSAIEAGVKMYGVNKYRTDIKQLYIHKAAQNGYAFFNIGEKVVKPSYKFIIESLDIDLAIFNLSTNDATTLTRNVNGTIYDTSPNGVSINAERLGDSLISFVPKMNILVLSCSDRNDTGAGVTSPPYQVDYNNNLHDLSRRRKWGFGSLFHFWGNGQKMGDYGILLDEVHWSSLAYEANKKFILNILFEFEDQSPDTNTNLGNEDQSFTDAFRNIYTNGNRLRIHSTSAGQNGFIFDGTTGRVGIGVDPSSYDLQVGGTGLVRAWATGAPAFIATNKTTNSWIKMQMLQNWGVFGTQTNHPFYFISNNINRGGILANGNWGIGTVSPDALLDVEGGSVRFSDYGSGTVTGTPAKYLAVESDGDVIEVDAPTGGDNIYTADGTLTGDRTVTMGGNDLILSDGKIRLNDGQSSVFVGDGTGANVTSATDNVAFGNVAGNNLTTGYYNVYLGSQAGKKNSTGFTNTIIGTAALFESETGYDQIALGVAALRNDIDGFTNIGLGGNSLRENKSGTYNIGIGSSAGRWGIDNTQNIWGGHFSGFSNRNGDRNISFGHRSNRNATENNNTLSLGYETANSVYGDGNISIGYRANNDLIFSAANQTLTVISDSTLTYTGHGYQNGDILAIYLGSSTIRDTSKYYEGTAGADQLTGLLQVIDANTVQVFPKSHDLVVGETGSTYTFQKMEEIENSIVIGNNEKNTVDNQLVIGKSIFATDINNLSLSKVGIGTATPDAKLDVEGGTIRLTDFAGDGTKYLTIDNNGDVDTLTHEAPVLLFEQNGTAIRNVDYADGTDGLAINRSAIGAALDVKGITGSGEIAWFRNDADSRMFRFQEGGNNALLDMYSSSNSVNIRLTAAGTSYFNGSNVAIGTTSATEKLEVNGVAAASTGFRVGLTGATQIGNLLNVAGTMGFQGAGARSISLGSETNGELVRIDNNSGEVGIGTSTPDALLDVENGTVRFSDYGSGTVTGTPTKYLAVESDGDVIEVDPAAGMDAVVSTRSYVDNAAALVDLVSGQVYYNTTSSTFVVLP